MLLFRGAEKGISPRGRPCGRHQLSHKKSLWTETLVPFLFVVLAPGSFHRFFPLDFITHASISAIPTSLHTSSPSSPPSPQPEPPKPLYHCTSFTSSCHISCLHLFLCGSCSSSQLSSSTNSHTHLNPYTISSNLEITPPWRSPKFASNLSLISSWTMRSSSTSSSTSVRRWRKVLRTMGKIWLWSLLSLLVFQMALRKGEF